MAGDVKAAGDMVARFTDIGTRMRRPDDAGGAVRNDAQTKETGTPAGTASGDAVALTDTAARLQRAERSLATEPVVDTTRVERVRAAIADGSYEVNPSRIAEKLVSMEASLGAEKN